MDVLTNTDTSIYKELLPIIASFITAVATLLGVYIASKFNQKNNEVIMDKNLKQEKIKIKLNKIEDIYDHFYIWESEITNTYLVHVAYCNGVFSYKELIEQMKKGDENNSGNSFRKVQSLSNIYFPEVSLAFKDVLTSRDSLSELFCGKQQTKEACDNLIKTYTIFEKEAEKFKNTLSLIAKNL